MADPVRRLGVTLYNERYSLTNEEFEAVLRCNFRLRAIALETFLAASSILWLVTGRVKLMPRLVTTVAGGYAAASFSIERTWKCCAKEFLAVDGSYLQQRLAALLQEEAVHKPHLRALLEKYYYVEPLYDDSGRTVPGLSLRKREIDKEPEFSEDKISSSPREVIEPTLTKKSEDASINNVQGHGSNQGVMHADAFGDGFKGLLWSEGEESRKLVADGKTAQRHRDKMRVLERREYNRARYLERLEKRKTSGQDNAEAEL